MSTRSVSIANHHPRLRFDRRSVVRTIECLDAHASEIGLLREGLCGGELSLVFLTDTALAQLHGQFLDDPTITDVITFEGDPAMGSAGEICVSVDAAARHAGLRSSPSSRTSAPDRRTMAAFSAELTLYLVHGWLHLAGYDDLEPAKKRVMRRAEARAMRLLPDQPPASPLFRLAGEIPKKKDRQR